MGICSTKNKIENDSNHREQDRNNDSNNLVLTPHDIQILKSSWKIVAKDSGLAKYGSDMMIRIFLEHRELKPLWKFASDLNTQEQMNASQLLKAHGEKIFKAIDKTINALDHLDSIGPSLTSLGYSHCYKGTKDKHFPIFQASLISTLEDALKEQFTPDLRKAWIKVFAYIENEMKSGMRQYESQFTP